MKDNTRMRAEDRRELILEAATTVFGDYGYVGATTAQVARAADVSQPYVVRMFGTKEKLFLCVLDRALQFLLSAFRSGLAAPGDAPVPRRLGIAYMQLAERPGLLLSLMHGFVLGSDPEIGAACRAGFMEVYRLLRDEAGLSPEVASQFLSGGMMVNTMIGLRMVDDYASNPDVRELLDEAFPEKLDALVAVTAVQRAGSQ